MPEPVDLSAAETFLETRRTSFIKAGAILDRSFFQWCRSSEYGAVEILSLFPKGGNKADKVKYCCEIQCPTCKEWRVESRGKVFVSELISAMKPRKGRQARRAEYRAWDFECPVCAKARVEERERSYDPDHLKRFSQQLREEAQQKARERTPAFIENYLHPRRRWNDDMSAERRFATMIREELENEAVAAAVREMPREAFQRTPYWVAVSGEALRRADGKCSICGRNEPLSLHYRTHDRHGYEHTEDGLREILCLCQRCKNTHVLKTEVPRN
jgi:hypothetical protein